MGLGPYGYDRPLVTLEEARNRAAEASVSLKVEGQDPLDARKERARLKRLEEARAMTFRDCAEQFFQDRKASWKNDKHTAQFPAHMRKYVYPMIGELPVGEVDTDAVLMVLRQKVGLNGEKVALWNALPETASRVRQKIEKVLTWATVDGLRKGEKAGRPRHHASL
jgi:hypothetical protein